MKRLTTLYKEHTFIFLFDRPYHNEFVFSENVIPVVVPPPARHPFLWYLWFEVSVPRVLKHYKPDIFISPDGYLSLRDRTPSLPVIHDINFKHYPKDLPYLYSRYYNYYFPKFARKADRIATVSEFSKNDIASNFEIASDKIDVVYNGVGSQFKPLTEAEVKETRNKLTGGDPYFIYVSSFHKRKNVENLLRAFDIFKLSVNSSVKLVLAGNKRWWTSEMESAYQEMKYKDYVVFTGRVTEEDLGKYTAAAYAMVYASFFEGFGIPIVEAMRCKVPVITSNVSAMPETAGGAALLVDPFSEISIANAMTELNQNAGLRNKLIETGIKRANDFSWDRTADLLWQSVVKTVK
jgi:glycosyltransferase involved in cell wall biosynthesis